MALVTMYALILLNPTKNGPENWICERKSLIEIDQPSAHLIAYFFHSP